MNRVQKRRGRDISPVHVDYMADRLEGEERSIGRRMSRYGTAGSEKPNR
jgi:hypothetical protein